MTTPVQTIAPNSDKTSRGLHHFLQESTVREYQKIFNELLFLADKKRGRSEGYCPEITAIDLVDDWVESNNEQKFSQSTRAKRRAALTWYFSANQADDLCSKALGLIEPMQAAESKKIPKSKNLRRPSGRNIPEKDLKKLMTYLAENPGYQKSDADSPFALWGLRSLIYMKATLATGLRPNEWVKAHWTSELKTHIRVQSTKIKRIPPGWRCFTTIAGDTFVKGRLNLNPEWAKNIRLLNGELDQTPVDDEYEQLIAIANLTPEETAELRGWRRHSIKAAYREIPVKPEDIESVDQHMAMRSEYVTFKSTHALRKKSEKDASNYYYTLVRNTIFQACKSVFHDGRTYSLYDLRSKFSSNTKAEFGRQAAIEALGHNNNRTIGKSYGHISDANRASKQFGKTRRRVERETQGVQPRIPPLAQIAQSPIDQAQKN